MITNTLPRQFSICNLQNFSARRTRAAKGLVVIAIVFSLDSPLHRTFDARGGESFTRAGVVRSIPVAEHPKADRTVAKRPMHDAASSVASAAALPDIGISKKASRAAISVSELLTYTLEVSNAWGASVATGVIVTDVLPAGVVFRSSMASHGACSRSSSSVVCALGSLSVGQTAHITIGVTPISAGLVTNTAVVSSLETDANLDNNASQVSTQVCPNGIISNGVVQLGVRCEGTLNVAGGPPSPVIGTTIVGLRYIPTGNEATAHVEPFEGWGVADASLDLEAFASGSMTHGVRGLNFKSFTTNGIEATSVMRANASRLHCPDGCTTLSMTLDVTHTFRPSASPNLYQVDVAVTNAGNNHVQLLYQRVMDWDIEPTTDPIGYSTIVTGNAAHLIATTNGGCATPSPLQSLDNTGASGTFVDYGPLDSYNDPCNGALFRFDFGPLAPGATRQFTIYYGATNDEVSAVIALLALGAEAYSLGQPPTAQGKYQGAPNTFIFGFKDIGGDVVVPPTPIPTITPVTPVTPVPATPRAYISFVQK